MADSESLPSAIDLGAYRRGLRTEAARLVALPGSRIPWYLRQQALLFLAAHDPACAPVTRTGTRPETRDYREMIRFLRGEGDRLRSSDFATLAILARRSFVDRSRAVELTRPGLTASRTREIARKAPSFFLELVDSGQEPRVLDLLSASAREDLCLPVEAPSGNLQTLAGAVLDTHPNGLLRNELSLLRFARAFLDQWEEQDVPPEVITPGQVMLKLAEHPNASEVNMLQIQASRAATRDSIYAVPAWCKTSERWRFQLGFLLRFMLSGQPDFTRPVRRAGWRETEFCYRPAESHWYQRIYGMYSAQPAFGDDWLPVTEWLEGFLLALLRWPGCQLPDGFGWVHQGIDVARTQISQRIARLKEEGGSLSGALILPMSVKRPTAEPANRSLRVCVVQTAIPADGDFQKHDLALDDPAIRSKQRNHLSAALAAVERMLALRETHKGREGRLDWLILPELAVHPKDVRTHLIPFARAHKAVILAGLTYEEIFVKQPLVNSALWVIPERSDAYGLQIRTRRQGKAHLAPDEQEFNQGADAVKGFRPCQWLIGYPWSHASDARPVWLTGTICYDATDLALMADLRNLSDVVAVPALNRDVKTFDQMALALHYHMFQLVIVANNGQYGGSNAYWPTKDPHSRQVFHTYGQAQASIAFLEIDDLDEFLNRCDVYRDCAEKWKYPPAGLNIPSPECSS